MSSDPFARVAQSVIRSHLSNGAKVLYANLLLYAAGKPTCWPSMATLCRDLSASRWSVQRWENELVEARLVVISRRDGGHGNLYHITTTDVDITQGASVLHDDITQGANMHHDTDPGCKYAPSQGANMHHRSRYREIEKKDDVLAPSPTTDTLTSTTQGDRLSVQAVTICGILGLVETDGQVAAVRKIVEAVGAEAQNGTIDPVGEARKLRERSESPTLNAYRGWLNKALTFARERSRPAAQPMVPIAVRPLSAEITQIEGREARLRRQYPKWSPEADRAWVMKKDKQAGERPPWLT